MALLRLCLCLGKLISLFSDHICSSPLLVFKLLVQLEELSTHGLSIRGHAHRLIVHAEAALSCRDATNLVQVALQLHELGLFGLNDLGEVCNLDFRLLLVLLVLRLHLKHLALLVEELIVRLTKYALHLIELYPHGRILILK